MEEKRHVADRVRPILQAMERSIDAARRQRLNDPAAPTPEAATPIAGPSIPIDSTSRLKARPKRPSHFVDQSAFHSQAG